MERRRQSLGRVARGRQGPRVIFEAFSMGAHPRENRTDLCYPGLNFFTPCEPTYPESLLIFEKLRGL